MIQLHIDEDQVSLSRIELSKMKTTMESYASILLKERLMCNGALPTALRLPCR